MRSNEQGIFVLYFLTPGHFCPRLPIVKGAEFIRRIRKLGRQNGVAVRFVAARGRGSHGRLYYGNGRTVVKDRKKELPTGLRRAMLDQLGLPKNLFD